MTASRSASVRASSSTRNGSTPLSETFHATWFSQIDCRRSMANGSKRISRAVYLIRYAAGIAVAPTSASNDLVPELALIPGGEFVMGSDDGEEDERPRHTVNVDEFLISVRPVTNVEYARFVRATNQRPPAIYDLPL